MSQVVLDGVRTQGKSASLLGDLPPLPGAGNPTKARRRARKARDRPVATGLATRDHGGTTTARRRPRGGGKDTTASAIDLVKQQRDQAIAAGAKVGYLCAIGGHVMRDPVRSATRGGPTFERATIERWIEEKGRVCPITGEVRADPVGVAAIAPRLTFLGLDRCRCSHRTTLRRMTIYGAKLSRSTFAKHCASKGVVERQRVPGRRGEMGAQVWDNSVVVVMTTWMWTTCTARCSSLHPNS